LIVALLSFILSAPTAAFPQSVREVDPCLANTDESEPVLKDASRPTRRIQNAQTQQQIKIVDLRFDGATQVPLTEQNVIAAKIMALDTLEPKDWIDEIKARVSDAWQHRGFFKVEVEAEGRELGSDGDTKDVSLTLHVDEGRQYRLGVIRFLHGTQFAADQLRPLIPISEGDVFDTHKISDGLTVLRKAYDEIGFINFTVVPDTTIDEPNASCPQSRP